MRSKGSSQTLRRPNSHENTKSSVLHGEYLHFTVTKHSILHLVSSPCGPKISSRTAFESSLRLPVSIGAFVKTLANVGPEAQFQPVAHSMRPILSNISRFQSIASVQSCARGLCGHFLVSERLFGTFCHPQTVETSVFPRGIAICVQRLGLHYVMGGGWELSIQMSM